MTTTRFEPRFPQASRPVTIIRAGSARTTLSRIIKEIWEARELVVQITTRDITVRYTQAVMGFAWALLMPMMIVGAGLVFRVVLSTLAGTPVQGSSVASLALKALPWAFFSVALSTGTQSIIASANLIGKVHFPREALPIAAVAAQGVDFLVGVALLTLLLPLLHVPFTLQLLWLPVLMCLLFVFTLGCALVLSCANLFYRDVKYIVQVVLNFGIFATPVFFEPQMLGPTFGAWMMRLPLSPFIQAFDVAVVRSHNLFQPLEIASPKGLIVLWSPWMLLYAVGLSIVALLVGLRVFRRGAGRFAEMA